MDLIRIAIERPIAIIAAVLMVLMFGVVSLQTIPIQLAPDVNRPVIQIGTNWPGAAPAEVEREIVNRQEDALRGLEGLEEMTSRSRNGSGQITLTFGIGTDMDRALLLVANRLDRVSNYPDEADEPTLSTADANDNAIAWFSITHTDPEVTDLSVFGEFVEDVVQERLERVPGVAQVNVFGGAEREMQIIIDPARLAQYELTIGQVLGALRDANISLSAGDVDEGKRRYVVRTDNDFSEIAQVEQVLIRSQAVEGAGIGRVTLGDLADVRFGYKEAGANIRFLGDPAIAVNAQRETGANVIEVMSGIRDAVEELRSGILPEVGLNIQQVYDETEYIEGAIDLVQQNILYGGALAALVLLVFLRSGRATLVIALAIPVSVVGSFVAMAALGRSLNVISLAGIAFAVGMVVDAAIVVLENIYRLRQQGMSAREAAYKGASQVWGAILVSALTTVMVFIPILVMELEVGQLFRDIAVAISVSVMLSLVVAVTVIPALTSRLFSVTDVGDGSKRIRLPVIDRMAHAFVRSTMGFTRAMVRRKTLGLMLVAAISSGSALVATTFLPDLDYLPDGNRNFIFGVILPPPGYNLETSSEIARNVEGAVRGLWASETGPESAPGEPPKIQSFFFVSTQTNSFVGAASVDPTRAGELIPVLRGPIFREPGTFGFMSQASLFGRGIGGSNSIDLDISGGDLDTILTVALQAFGRVNQALPREQGTQVRPVPGLELGAPEVRVVPDSIRLADGGVTATELALTVDTFNDGLRVAEITVDGQRIDLTLMGPEGGIATTQEIGGIPVVTDGGTILQVRDLANVVVTAGPTEIQHKERLRTVTLQIRPSGALPLERALSVIETEVMEPMREEGLPAGVTLRQSGTADKLQETWDAMVWDLLIALIIVYLVMAVLFESFFYPLIIMLAVPLAAAGGVAGLVMLNVYVPQNLDMLTLLGFVILVGIVVNNAILLVHQSLFHLREEKMAPTAAILEATENRIRPIFMSTLTSIFGMLPLVLVPGAGSELYRGLGSVVVGGLSLSAVLTLLIIPPLLSVFMAAIEGRRAASTGSQIKPVPQGGDITP